MKEKKVATHIRMNAVKAEAGRKAASLMFGQGLKLQLNLRRREEVELQKRIERIGQRAEDKGQAGVDVIHDFRRRWLSRGFVRGRRMG